MTFPHFHGKEKQRGGSRTLRENPAHAAAEKIRPTACSMEEPICRRPVRQSQSVRQVSAPIPGRIGLSGLGRGREQLRNSLARPLCPSVVAHTDWLFALN